MSGAQPQAFDTSNRREFVDYYAAQSLSEETRQRVTRLRDSILRAIPAANRGRALDVADIGCNTGALSRAWAEKGHCAHGIDVSEPLVAIARERTEAARLTVEYRVGTATALPWPDQSMDVCCLPELLEHVADWQTCLGEAIRVLRPHGVLYLSTTNVLCPAQQEFNLPFYSWYPSFLKRRYEALAVTTRPEVANHATYPAVNWFSYYWLRAYFAARGMRSLDRFDIARLGGGGGVKGMALHLICSIPPARLVAHLASPGLAMLAIKTGG